MPLSNRSAVLTAFFAGLGAAWCYARISSPKKSRLSLQARENDQSENLAAIATLTAGVAHELATPLSTIAVVSADFERQACDVCRDGNCKSDARLIRTQVERCRDILEKMRLRHIQDGETDYQVVTTHSLRQLIEDKISDIHNTDTITWLVDDIKFSTRNAEGLAHSAAVLLDNALDATAVNDGTIEVTIKKNKSEVIIQVKDTGPGMAESILNKVGTPFFTTKSPGRGLGLGIFLVKNMAAKLGGKFDITSRPQVGTVAKLIIPVDEQVN